MNNMKVRKKMTILDKMLEGMDINAGASGLIYGAE